MAMLYLHYRMDTVNNGVEILNLESNNVNPMILLTKIAIYFNMHYLPTFCHIPCFGDLRIFFPPFKTDRTHSSSRWHF